MYLLDTNVISETRKIRSGAANVGVQHWSSQIHTDELFLSVITILEIQQGILSIQRKDKRQAQILSNWFNGYLLLHFDKNILSIDPKVALACAALNVPDRKPANDSLIAATALVHDLTLVTRNTSDFIHTGVKLFNPFT